MKLVTFNIRLDCGQDGANNFCNRKEYILKKINSEQPDLICFQEVLPHVAIWLKQNLKEYYILGCPRGAQLDDEQVCIAFRYDRFNVLKLDSYWLSPTPYHPGSRYSQQSICPRICTEVTLQDLSTSKVFRLTNTHLDHEGQPSRIQAVGQILLKQKSVSFFPNIPSILVGDMNALPDSAEIKQITQTPGWQCFTSDIGTTYHGFGKDQQQIDYVFATFGISCLHIEKWEDRYGEIYLSDHYPVCADLQIL